MLLAAGRGRRLGKLTDNIPKPLLKVGDKALIEYHIEALAKAGVKDIVINLSYLANKIISALGNGERYGVSIEYSYEPQEKGLETGGGIFQALPLLGKEPFIAVNSDISTDYPFEKLFTQTNSLAHIVLVNNPDFHPEGDFSLQNNILSRQGEPKYTFAGIAVYHPDFFAGCKPGHFSITPMLKAAADKGQLTGELYEGKWVDAGTQERLLFLQD